MFAASKQRDTQLVILNVGKSVTEIQELFPNASTTITNVSANQMCDPQQPCVYENQQFDVILNHRCENLGTVMQFLTSVLPLLNNQNGLFVLDYVRDMSWIEALRFITPKELRFQIRVYDERHLCKHKILFIIDRSLPSYQNNVQESSSPTKDNKQLLSLSQSTQPVITSCKMNQLKPYFRFILRNTPLCNTMILQALVMKYKLSFGKRYVCIAIQPVDSATNERIPNELINQAKTRYYPLHHALLIRDTSNPIVASDCEFNFRYTLINEPNDIQMNLVYICNAMILSKCPQHMWMAYFMESIFQETDITYFSRHATQHARFENWRQIHV